MASRAGYPTKAQKSFEALDIDPDGIRATEELLPTNMPL